ncbi:MAG: xanthine dehydrogenase family protein molybdopterin-binding subunit [Chloroflexi bacterium]|nr:xanthine dehydrogenase family protein molybdopterin-binding subunit [Chloroflexota bacterium]
MTTRYLGERITRNEDARLLTGRAQFIDDVDLPRMLHVAFLRSIHAHARIRSIDVARARNRKGIVAIYTANDLGDYWQPGPLLVSPPPVKKLLAFNERCQVPLAKNFVRHVGEPVAMIVAASRYIAEDALDDIDIDYEPLPVVADLESAPASDAPLVHNDLPSNLAAHVIQEKGDVDAVWRDAAVVIRRRFRYDHGTAAPMETRGIVAQWDAHVQHLTVWDTTQAPIPIRNGLASRLGLSETQVRVIAPFIGGGFGPKIMMFYPEELIVPWAAMQLGRPLKWIEDRRENFVAMSHEREQIHDAAIALNKQGKILAIKDSFLHDSGAYIPYGLTVPINAQCTLLGMYKVPNYYSEFKAVFTNKTIVTPYRGAGRQHGVFVMERLLDLAARELNIDPTEIRRRNFIQPYEFPYNNEIIYQDFAPLQYDSGNYGAVLDRAKQMIDYDTFIAEEQPRLRDEGKQIGIGLVCYVEGTGIGPYEGARVHVETNSKVTVATGVGTQGQGHFTSFAQIVAEQLGVDVRDIRVITGDTAEFNWGTGTFASRGAVVAGNAVNEAAKAVREKAIKLAAEELDVYEGDLELVNGRVQVKGLPQKNIALGELAKKANPLRGAVKPNTEPGLEATRYFGPQSGVTSSGAHAMIVEVDPGTMQIKILKYVVVHDCGTVINPLILEGQVCGGVAQGIGNAFYEKLAYDENGQLLSGSFMDYLLPTALEVPRIEIGHEETPSPWNPLGVKGAGEAGAIPVGPLFAQAIENALAIRGMEILEIPLSPNRLWELTQECR